MCDARARVRDARWEIGFMVVQCDERLDIIQGNDREMILVIAHCRHSSSDGDVCPTHHDL